MWRLVWVFTVCICPVPHLNYLLFWYQVLTWVSVRFSFAASSIRSCTLRYFWRSKVFSRLFSWWSVKAVRAFLGFLGLMRFGGLSFPDLSSSSLSEIQKNGEPFHSTGWIIVTWWFFRWKLRLQKLHIQQTHTVKPVLSDHSKTDKTKVLMANGSLMKVESIAECSPWSILQYFWPALNDDWSINQFWSSFWVDA